MKLSTLTLLAFLASIALASAAAAPARREPQVVVAGQGLQDYFDSIGESIDVNSDQLLAQRWMSSPTPDNDPTSRQIELVRRSGRNAVGLYDAGGSLPPRQFELFRSVDEGECRAITLFQPATQNLSVTLFDRHGVLRSTDALDGLTSHHYGFYISGPGGVGYSQDVRQSGGAVRVLAFAGTGRNTGGVWLCLEDRDPNDPDPDSDYDDTILFLGPVDVTPTNRSTWSWVKSLFR